MHLRDFMGSGAAACLWLARGRGQVGVREASRSRGTGPCSKVRGIHRGGVQAALGSSPQTSQLVCRGDMGIDRGQPTPRAPLAWWLRLHSLRRPSACPGPASHSRSPLHSSGPSGRRVAAVTNPAAILVACVCLSSLQGVPRSGAQAPWKCVLPRRGAMLRGLSLCARVHRWTPEA